MAAVREAGNTFPIEPRSGASLPLVRVWALINQLSKLINENAQVRGLMNDGGVTIALVIVDLDQDLLTDRLWNWAHARPQRFARGSNHH